MVAILREHRVEELGKVNFSDGISEADLIVRKSNEGYSIDLIRLNAGGLAQSVYDIVNEKLEQMKFCNPKEAEQKFDELGRVLKAGGKVVVTSTIVPNSYRARIEGTALETQL